MALVSLLVTLSPTAPLTGINIASPAARSAKFCVPVTVLRTRLGEPADAVLYLMYTYVTSLTPDPIITSGPLLLVTLPDARFTTGASIDSESETDMLNPPVVVVDEPVENRDSFDFIIPIVVLY